MGYYTDFKLEVLDEDLDPIVEKTILDEINSTLNSISGYCFFIRGNLQILNESTWYDHPEHMLSLSKGYPDLIFQLDGHGEDKSDLWRFYFKNGKSLRVKALFVFPSYDEDLLK